MVHQRTKNRAVSSGSLSIKATRYSTRSYQISHFPSLTICRSFSLATGTRSYRSGLLLEIEDTPACRYMTLHHAKDWPCPVSYWLARAATVNSSKVGTPSLNVSGRTGGLGVLVQDSPGDRHFHEPSAITILRVVNSAVDIHPCFDALQVPVPVGDWLLHLQRQS